MSKNRQRNEMLN